MRVLGWTVPELRAAPARVIRAHFARIFVGLVWNPALAEAAAGPPPPRGSFGRDLAAYGSAVRAKLEAKRVLETVERALWPEDDDG
jgi:hypothetical protein